MSSWVSLHTHSQYSILDSTASPKALAKRAKEMGAPALALTDFGNLYGAVDFFKACKDEEIKAIIGCELMLAPDACTEKKKAPGVPVGTPIVLLVKNAVGYHNLCKLSSAAHIDGFYYFPRIDKELLAQHSEGLICLSGPLSSKLSRLVIEGQDVGPEIEWYCRTFGDDFYLEVQNHVMETDDGLSKESWLHAQYQDFVDGQQKVIAAFKELSEKYGVPLVATNDVHYINRDDWKAHEILMNVQSGEPCSIIERDSFGNPKAKVPNPKRQVTSSHEHDFKSYEEMKKRFVDVPEALEETLKIAEKCTFTFDFSKRNYPVFVPPELEDKPYTAQERKVAAEEYLCTLCHAAIPKKYTAEALKHICDSDPMKVVTDRLNYELDIIISKGMCDYLLIVRDFIAWAKEQGIPVGPGRGSGAGSIILYLIGVTDIEPLRFSLFFERFINPERLSYPDIDVDICMERRHEVIDYTLRKYGRDNVAQIITFGTMKAKMVVRDVGRVLSVPLIKVNKIAKLIPDDLNITLEKALEVDQELKALCESDSEAREIIEYGKKLEGSIRNTGIHAAGLIISGDTLTNHIPICNAKDSDIYATQFSMKPVEAVGMLKIDFLGLKTLTSIQKAVDTIEQRSGIKIDWGNLPLDDAKTFELLTQGKTKGIFQLESSGMQDLSRQLHIDKFEEIIAVGALYRPGPMEMIPSFIARKHGSEVIDNDHPLMKDILDETYGIMVYQEQVMQIAQKLAGYSLGEGDVLRRAMGKKDHKEMASQREKFRAGAIANGISEEVAIRIFDKVEKFASYGFNKSHATAYGYLSYVTAFLKANYPKEWHAALMTTDIDDLAKVTKHISEAAEFDIPTLPPDVNESSIQFFPTEKGIRFALAGIKGVGHGVVEAILEERKKNGAFKNLFDFLKRIDTTKVGKKVVQNLIIAGCFDWTGWSRKCLVENLEPMFECALREQKEKSKGVMDLFELIGEQKLGFEEPQDTITELPKQEILKKEKELLGFYLSGHPMDEYRDTLQQIDVTPLESLKEIKHGSAIKAAFIIESVSTKISKAQKKFAILTISDGVERYELPIWPNQYEEKGHLLIENSLILAVLIVNNEDGDVSLKNQWFDELIGLDEARLSEAEDAFKSAKRYARKKPVEEKAMTEAEPAKQILKILFDAESAKLSHILHLKKLFHTYPGNVPVEIHFQAADKSIGKIDIDAGWGVTLNSHLQSGLEQLPSLIRCGVS